MAESTDPFTRFYIQDTHRQPILRRCRARYFDTNKITGITTSATLHLVQPAMMLRLLLLRLPGHVYTRCFQQAVHELISNIACQTVNIRLYIIARKAHDNHRLTLEARVLAKLL